MILHRVLLLVLVGSAAAWAEPQRGRQTPFSVGMRFLGNLRDGMTRTFQGIFGGGPSRSKEVAGGRPVKQPHQPQSVVEVPPDSPTGTPFREAPPAASAFNAAPPKAAPPAVAPFKDAPPRAAPPTASPPSSFFTVVHESDVSTAFPDTQGFSDESFEPNSFLRDTKPFQGTIDEDQLPFFPPRTEGHSNSQPFAHNQLASPHHSFLPGTPPSSDFPTFGTISPEDTLRDNSIPFGNTANFNLGSVFKRSSPPTGLPFTSQAVRDTQEAREILGPAPQQVEIQGLKSHSIFPETQSPGYHPDVHTSLHQNQGSQETHTTTGNIPSHDSTVSTHHPTILLKSHSDSPTHVPTQFFTESQRVSNAPEREATTQHRATTQHSVKTPGSLRPVAHQAPQQAKEHQQQQSKKPVVPLKVGAGHINAGTRMRVTPKENEDGSQGVDVSGYEFGYGVLDTDTGNQFFHAEKREEGQTRGSYKIQLPDGRVQTVTYVANSNGFQPKITYDGKAKYPEVAASTTVY